MTPQEFDEARVLTVGQISRLLGKSENRTTTRLLTAGGVRVLRIGRKRVVEKLGIRAAMPALYEALVLATLVAERAPQLGMNGHPNSHG